MHQAVRWERNCAQVVFLSNENMPLALERDDRRHLVVYTPVAGDEALYRRVSDFLASGGASKFLYYLMSFDLGHFNEHTKPLMTEAKAALIDLGLKPHERFVNEWLQGYLDLPVNVCSAEQLYRVYRRWCDLNGERFPTAQGTFTNSVRRFVGETVEKDAGTGARLEPALHYKPVQLKHDSGPRKCMRCWIPRGAAAPDGVSEGEWAAAAVDAFETLASRYGRRYASDEPE
jgi:putative DNA primase/helicase